MYDNLVISPGHGVYLPGAIGNGRKEYDIVFKFCVDLTERLKDKIKINMVYDDKSKSVSNNIGYLTQMHKKYDVGNGKSLHLFFHINSASSLATGYETLYKNEKLFDLATVFSNESSKILGLRNRGNKKRTDLGMLNNFSHSLLLELFFINNKIDMDLFYKNYNKLLDVYESIILKNVRNLKFVDTKKSELKVDKTVVSKEVEVKSVEKYNPDSVVLLNETGRKEAREFIRRGVFEGIFTSKHENVENYSDIELLSYSLAYLNRKLKGGFLK